MSKILLEFQNLTISIALNHNGYLVIGKVENFNELPYKISLPLHTQEVPKFNLAFDN
jgi:hypothetical protein